MNVISMKTKIKNNGTLSLIIALTVMMISFQSVQAQQVWQSSSSSTTNGNITTNNPTFAVPSGTASGDLLVVAIFDGNGSAVTYTPPAGWQLIRTTNQSNSFGLKTYYKIAGAAETGLYVFTQSISQVWSGSITRITGVNPQSPISISVGASGTTGNAAAPSITPTEANTMVLVFHGRKNTTKLNADASTTQRHSYNSGNNAYSNLLATYNGVLNTASGTKTATGSTSNQWAAQQICITTQTLDRYRTRATGNWNNPATWEQQTGNGIWQRTNSYPYSNLVPVISGTATSKKDNTTNTTATITLPSNINTGDLLLIFWSDAAGVDVDPQLPVDSGWTVLYNNYSGNGSNDRNYRKAWYKVARGSESSITTTSSHPERVVTVAYRIEKGTYDDVPVAITNDGSSTSANPSSLTSGFGAVPTIWMSVIHSTGTSLSSLASNYTLSASSRASATGTGNSHASVYVTTRTLIAATENPGTFTLGTNSKWAAATIAIRGRAKSYVEILSGHTVTVTADQNVDDITIKTGGTLTLSGGSLSVNGNWMRESSATFNSASDTLIIGGISGDQTITEPTSGTIPFLTIDKSQDDLILGSDATVTNGLNLKAGLFALSNFDLYLNSNTTISNASQSSYIITNGTGQMKQSISTARSYLFPIGSATAYNPVTFNWTAAPGITRLDGSYTGSNASGTSGLPFTVFNCSTGSAILNNGFWTFTSTGTLSNNYTLTTTRRGHTNAGARFSSHGIIRRASDTDDWGIAGIYNTNDNTVVSPVNTGFVTVSQTGNESFGQFAMAVGAGSSSIGIWVGQQDENTNVAVNWGCNTIPTNTIDVIIPKNVRRNARVQNTNLNTKNLTIVQGANLSVSEGTEIVLADNSVFTNNGNFSTSNGTLEFAGKGQLTGTSNTALNNLIANDTVTVSSSLSISDTLQLNNNGNITGITPQYGNNATLLYNNGTTVSTGNEWNTNSNAAGNGNPKNVAVINGTTITITGSRTIAGTLKLKNGTIAVENNTLHIRGNVEDSTGFIHTAATGTVHFLSNGAQQNIVEGNYGTLEINDANKIFQPGKTYRIASQFISGAGTGHTTTGSTFEFNGLDSQLIPSFSYYHLVLGGSNNKIATSSLNVAGKFTVNSSFRAGNFTHIVNGDIENNGTINPENSTFVFNNVSTISGTSATTFNNISINGTVNTQSDLNINGNWINNGTFAPNTNTVRFTNSTVPVATLLNGGMARKQNFHNLIIDKPGQTLMTASLDSLTLSGTFTLEAGTFGVANTQILLNQGNWINNGGIFTAGNSSVHFTNTDNDQSIGGTATTQSFTNITVNKNGKNLTLGGSTATLNIGGDLTFISGSFVPGNGSTVAYNKQGAQNIPVIAYHNLSLSGSGSKTVTNGNLVVNATLTIENNVELNMGTNQLQNGNVFAANGNGKLRTQNTSNSPLPDGVTWSFGILYEGAAEQTINNGTFDGGIELNNSNGAKLKGNTTIGAVTLTAGDLSIDSNTLVLKGSFNGSENNALKGSRKSNLTINEANTAGTLYFKNAGTGNYLRRFTFGATASATLGNRLHITSGADAGSVSVKGSSKLYSNNNLVLQSDSLGTAYVAEIEGCTSCTAIEGEVEVERFIPTKRTWRFITIPVTGNYTLRQQLVRQQNGAAIEYPAPYCAGSGLPAPAATGYGTLITAHSMSSCSNAASMGADLIINGSSSSVRFYTHINGTGSWASASNTPNFNAAPNQDGYLVFVRGDRSQLNTTEGSTTFRFKGQLKQGTKTNGTTISATYGVMSNPYAAPIDLDHVYNNGEGNNTKFERNFWIWDGDKTAGVNSLGGYRSISFDGAGNYDCADCEGISVDSFLRVNSGQAFMVQRKASNTASSVSMTVKESDKVGSKGNISSFRVTGAAVPKFRVQLYRATGTVMEGFMDGALVRFGTGYSAGTNEPYDIYKYNNFDENISLVRGTNYLSIESRPVPTATDTIYLPFWNTTNRGYALRFQTENFGNTGQTAILVDKFTNTRTIVPLNGTTVVYPFSVTSAAASKSLSRFYVVFTPPQTSLPVTFTQVKAAPQSNGIKVEWDVANEEDLASYEVERSNDGVSFTRIGSKAPLNQQKAVTYQWLDANPFDGTNYYRIKSVDSDGTYQYSTTVRVTLDNKTGGIRVFPTVITQQNVTVEIKNQPQGVYQVNLTTTAGQIIHSSSIRYTGGIASRSIEFGKQMLASGTYFLVLTDEAGNKQTFKLLAN